MAAESKCQNASQNSINGSNSFIIYLGVVILESTSIFEGQGIQFDQNKSYYKIFLYYLPQGFNSGAYYTYVREPFLSYRNEIVE